MGTVREDIAKEHLRAHYAIIGDLQALPGEHDENFLVEAGQARMVLRVAAADQDVRRTAFILALLSGLENSSARIPRLVPDSQGRVASVLLDKEGRMRTAWVTTYVEGSSLGARLTDPKVARAVGRALAALDRDLAGLLAPQEVGPTPWDLTHPEGALTLIYNVQLGDEEMRIRTVLEALATSVLPALAALDSQPIHNDANPDNVLLAGDVAFIDFGDAVRAPRIVEVAVAGSYLVNSLTTEALNSPLAGLIAGYGSVVPLSTEELEVLPALMRGRVCLAMGNALARAHHDPERASYVLRHFHRARRRLDALELMDDAAFVNMLHTAQEES